MIQHRNNALELNYSNVLFCFRFSKGQTCRHKVKDHTLAYVYSGELLIESGQQTQRIVGGECVFLPKNHRVNITRMSVENEPFKAIFLVFDRAFLRRFYQEYAKQQSPHEEKKPIPDFVKLPCVTAVKSLFYSLTPFFESPVVPTGELMRLKQHEGLIALLDINNDFRTTLFDFVEPWKIDILEFLNENYMYELSVSEIALYTGRSLATFKRDFRKLTPLSPQKWLMQKRLEVAGQELKEGKKASDIYLKLGFKSLSHFSTAFKKQYGYPPQQFSG